MRRSHPPSPRPLVPTNVLVSIELEYANLDVQSPDAGRGPTKMKDDNGVGKVARVVRGGLFRSPTQRARA